MKKTIIATLLALSALLSAGTYVCAYGGGDIATPYYLYTASVTSTLITSGTTVTCESTITCDSTVTRIYGTQYLEKKNGDKWDYVNSWSDSTSKNYLTMSNTEYDLDEGTYHLRTTFTVYSGSSSETIEKTSKEKTVS